VPVLARNSHHLRLRHLGPGRVVATVSILRASSGGRVRSKPPRRLARPRAGALSRRTRWGSRA